MPLADAVFVAVQVKDKVSTDSEGSIQKVDVYRNNSKRTEKAFKPEPRHFAGD